nr:helix-turn-helix transcriptional regulator [uncultured Roseococcus sp.]
MTILPYQLRAARGLVDWSQSKLAEEAGVSLSTVKDFEAGRRSPIPASLEAIQRAIEAAGVIFVAENGEGPGVRLRKVPKVSHEAFWAAINRFAAILPTKGIALPRGQMRFGFSLVHEPPNRSALTLDGRPLGCVTWRDGTVAYDPDIGLQGQAEMTEDEMTAWISRAYGFGSG